jgi:gamma-glutamyltranspeptidase/glutathione hydrolase
VGVVLPESGIWWQNRGSLTSIPGLRSLNRTQTTIPQSGAGYFDDGRLLVYGTMGHSRRRQYFRAVGLNNVPCGSGTPLVAGAHLGEQSTTLKLSHGTPPSVIDAFASWASCGSGGDFDEPHGPCRLLASSSWIEGGEDPRSDGSVAAW